MNKHLQDRFGRLALVASQDGSFRSRQAAPQWWGPARTSLFKGSDALAGAAAGTSRMTVMARPSRNWALSTLAFLRNCFRSYFVSGSLEQGPPRRAAVLSFRRHGLRRHEVFARTLAEDFTGKKANGSVHWDSNHEVAPREGGRG